MDTYRDHPSDFDLPSTESGTSSEAMTEIGTDERRMHVRAYNYWASLLDGRDFPSIEDLEPAEVDDFATHSVLLDFTSGGANPAIPYVGAAIREECALGEDVRTIADVPSRSLLSRLTDHFMQIIANRAPVGFEAEFENPRGDALCYRGILMPFSSDGDTIDFIYGVISWKHVDAEPMRGAGPIPVAIAGIEEPQEEPTPELLELTEVFDAASPSRPEALVVEAFAAAEAMAEPDRATEPSYDACDAAPSDHVPWRDGPRSSNDIPADLELQETASLADRLSAARETADAVKAGEGRTRAALYKALSLAYDFAVAAVENPADYAELLAESGMKAQARAPMTPIVKLVFGVDYDKARLTEFAAALSHAQRQGIAVGAFADYIGQQPGGLKALVAAEREARRPQADGNSKAEAARQRLRSAPSISLADVPADAEFAVVITRRGPLGTHEAIAVLDDDALVERAIRQAA